MINRARQEKAFSTKKKGALCPKLGCFPAFQNKKGFFGFYHGSFPHLGVLNVKYDRCTSALGNATLHGAKKKEQLRTKLCKQAYYDIA
jgi:hypothetical protein